jgi:hypothetical protein
MKTWLRDDGIWVSKKPKVYVVGKDCSGNNILNTDSVVLFQKWNKKLRFGLSGKTISDMFYTNTEDKYKILLLKDLEPIIDQLDHKMFEDYEWEEYFFDDEHYEYLGHTPGSLGWEAVYKSILEEYYVLVNFGDKMGEGFDNIRIISKEKAIKLLEKK